MALKFEGRSLFLGMEFQILITLKQSEFIHVPVKANSFIVYIWSLSYEIVFQSPV